jgi:hypothetical protein
MNAPEKSFSHFAGATTEIVAAMQKKSFSQTAAGWD